MMVCSPDMIASRAFPICWECEHFAGVLLMATEKEIYALPVEPAVRRRRVPAYVPVPRALAAAERVAGPPGPSARHPAAPAD